MATPGKRPDDSRRPIGNASDRTLGPGDSAFDPPAQKTDDVATERTSLYDLAPNIEGVSPATPAKPLPPRSTSAGSMPNLDITIPLWDKSESRIPSQFPILLGDYVLESKLGEGGMGVVFKARYRKLNRVVALKMIRSDVLGSDEVIDRFGREARSAAELDHPNIVPIYDFNEVDDRHFYTMAYVEGISLKAMIRQEGKIPLATSMRIIMQLCEAVNYANSKGIIHRDLKPENILIDPAGRPRITDFGLAKRIDENASQTEAGRVLGTAEYMPPEQAKGQVDKIGPHTDTYSLGAIMFHMVTGESAFPGSTVTEVLCKVILEPPPDPRSKNPDIPEELEAIILRSLGKEIHDRHATAGELAESLRGCIRRNRSLAVVTQNPTFTEMSMDASEVEEAVKNYKPKYRPLSSGNLNIAPASNSDLKVEEKKPSVLPWVILVGLLVGGVVAGVALLIPPSKPTEVASTKGGDDKDGGGKNGGGDVGESDAAKAERLAKEQAAREAKERADREAKELKDAKDQARPAVAIGEKALSEFGGNTTADDKAALVGAIDKLKAAIAGSDAAEILLAVPAITAEAAKLGKVHMAKLGKDVFPPVRKVYQGVALEAWMSKDFDKIPAGQELEANSELGVMVKLPQGSGYLYVLRPVNPSKIDDGLMLVYPKPNALNDQSNKTSGGELFPTGTIDYAPDAGKTASYYVVVVPLSARRDKLDVSGLTKSAGQSVFPGPADFLKRVLAEKTEPSAVGEAIMSVKTK